LCRSTAPCPSPIPTTKIARQTTLAWSLYSFIHSGILSDLDRTHGFMELRYSYFLLPSCLELTQPTDLPNAPPCKRHQHLCQCRCNRLYCCCSILPRCSVQHRFQNIFHIFLSQRSVTYRKSTHLLTLHFLMLTPSEDHRNLLCRDERQIFGRDG
jgi:hypothetical protein